MDARDRLRSPAAERRRFGYRRLGVLLRRDGVRMNKKKLYRLYREEGLAVRRRRGRKRATGTRAPMALPDGPNQRWSMDFVADALSWGRRLRILCIVDDFTREALALVVDTSFGGARMARDLDTLIARRGTPPSSSATTPYIRNRLAGSVSRSLSASMAVGGVGVNPKRNRKMSDHVKIITILAARPGKAGELRALLDSMLAPSRAEAGNLHYELWQARMDPDRLGTRAGS